MCLIVFSSSNKIATEARNYSYRLEDADDPSGVVSHGCTDIFRASVAIIIAAIARHRYKKEIRESVANKKNWRRVSANLQFEI